MLSYSLKQILSLVPEAYAFVKQAKVEEDFPLGSRDSCVASALRIQHDLHIAKQSIDPDIMEKVASAVMAYGADDDVTMLTGKLLARRYEQVMEKKASAASSSPEACMTKVASFEGDLSGLKDLEVLTKQAEELLELCRATETEPSDSVLRYAGEAYMSKAAAMDALNARFHATQDPMFAKLAVALDKEAALIPSGNIVKGLCKAVTGLDKKAGLNVRGFDFYKETLLVKSAAVTAARVRLGQQEFPIESVMKVPRHMLEQYLGADIAKEMSADPMTAKAVAESLPSDLQRVLVTVMKGC